MKFGVITFPGSNCDQDMLYVLRDILGQNVETLWHKDHDLKDCDFIVLPGGFSYGDYLRSGAIARFSPIMQSLIDFAHNGGHVLGICNGFQILCESGLLPGALLHNDNQQFICKNTYIKSATDNSRITSGLKAGEILQVPIAHGEGRYYIAADGLAELKENDQVLFRYCDANGSVTAASNPNGSVDNIAGVCNKSRNVFGMMPHPERASDECLLNTHGRAIFESIVQNAGVNV